MPDKDYHNSVCEYAQYNFLKSIDQKDCTQDCTCTQPESCEDIGAMCQQLWSGNDEDIAACVRANTAETDTTQPTLAMNAPDATSDSLYIKCCRHDPDTSCENNIIGYACTWDPDIGKTGKAIHVGADTTGVCNNKNAGESGCQYTSKPACKTNPKCQWDTPATPQPDIITSGCQDLRRDRQERRQDRQERRQDRRQERRQEQRQEQRQDRRQGTI